MSTQERRPIPYEFLPEVPAFGLTGTDMSDGEPMPNAQASCILGADGEEDATQLSGRGSRLRRRRMLGVLSAVLVVALWAAAGAPAVWGKTVWLCKPGQAADPCRRGLSTTVYSSRLKKLGVAHPKQVADPPIDCFYVYPTVSKQTTGNSNLHVDREERQVAETQAARYSQLCRVYAPLYRQVTLAGSGLGHPPTTPPDPALALADLRAAFGLYLRRHNHGRGFVLIGDSQGSFMLRQLIAKDIDPKPQVRTLLLSAILLGGDVLVKAGRDIGGDFKHIRACHSATQLQCVIAFSSFDEPVPSGTLFGRPLPILGTTAPPGDVVLCTNPAALGGGSGRLDPIFPSGKIGQLGSSKPAPPTVWAAVPGAYDAFCSSANDAHVLQITPVAGAPKPPETLGPAWGLHLLDANIALGNLISIVRRETTAFLASSR